MYYHYKYDLYLWKREDLLLDPKSTNDQRMTVWDYEQTKRALNVH